MTWTLILQWVLWVVAAVAALYAAITVSSMRGESSSDSSGSLTIDEGVDETNVPSIPDGTEPEDEIPVPGEEGGDELVVVIPDEDPSDDDDLVGDGTGTVVPTTSTSSSMLPLLLGGLGLFVFMGRRRSDVAPVSELELIGVDPSQPRNTEGADNAPTRADAFNTRSV